MKRTTSLTLGLGAGVLVAPLLVAAPAAADGIVVSTSDKAGDVRSQPRVTGATKAQRRSVDLRHLRIQRRGSTNVIKVKIRKVASGRLGGWDQVFGLTITTASGEFIGQASWSNRPRRSVSSWNEATQSSCDSAATGKRGHLSVRRRAATNTLVVRIPSRCLSLPYSGRVQLRSALGLYQTDAPPAAQDRLTGRIRTGW